MKKPAIFFLLLFAILTCFSVITTTAQPTFRLIINGGAMRTFLSSSDDMLQYNPWYTSVFHGRVVCNTGHLQVGAGVFSGGIDRQVVRDSGMIFPTTSVKYQPTSYRRYGPKNNAVSFAWPFISPYVLVNYRRDINKWIEAYGGATAGVFFAKSNVYETEWTKTRNATLGLNAGVQFKITRLLSIDVAANWFTTKQNPKQKNDASKAFEDYDSYRLNMIPLTAGLSMKF